MSLATAIRTGDVAELPSKRDEDWRWTDLRGLVRTLPPASPAYAGAVESGPFEASETLLIVNGRGADRLHVRDDKTVALRFVSKANETAHLARIAIEVDAGRSLTLLESYEGLGSGYVASTELDIRLGEGARLERVIIANDDADAVSVSVAKVTLGAGAIFEQTVLTSGAKRQRLETRVVHPGHGAAVRMDGAYVLADKRHADITTVVEHNGVDGATTQLTKGVVRDQARGIFQGRIVVAEG
ncbi:MAG TPA: SufD family Fe-S cluster assembly protein, partial [Caulobacteraceae bacterium]